MWFVSAASAVPYTPVIEELTSTPPNVLIILADDLGVDNVAVYGEDPQPPKTPNLDALAGQGVRFTNAYGYPICSPTRAALLTGRMARRTGMGAIVEWNDTYELPLDEVLIPEMLELGGWDYSTAAIGKWHLSAPRTPNAFAHPNLQGFDTYKGVIHNLYFEADDGEEHGKEGGEGGKGGKAGHGDGGHDGDGKNDYYHYDYVVNGDLRRGEVYATQQQTDDAIEAIREMEEPWFLYLAYNAVHSPFQLPPRSNLPPNAPPPQRYDAMVEYMDGEIGRLLAAIEDRRSRTIVVFLGDNGTPGGAITPPFEKKHGKTTVFEGGTNVPLIVAGPGVKGRGVAADALVHVVDVLPTLARLSGVDPALTGRPLDGVSFAEVLADPASSGSREFVYTERMTPAGPPPWSNQWRAARDVRYKLIISPEGKETFFDLQGRNDDGPGREPSELTAEERPRYEALKAEIERASVPRYGK